MLGTFLSTLHTFHDKLFIYLNSQQVYNYFYFNENDVKAHRFNRLSNLANFLELAREEGKMLIRLVKFLKINNKYTYSIDKIQR